MIDPGNPYEVADDRGDPAGRSVRTAALQREIRRVRFTFHLYRLIIFLGAIAIATSVPPAIRSNLPIIANRRWLVQGIGLAIALTFYLLAFMLVRHLVLKLLAILQARLDLTRDRRDDNR